MYFANSSEAVEAIYARYSTGSPVVIDSRKVQPGCIFFGLPGANVDGGMFWRAVIESGASLAVVGKAFDATQEGIIAVDDPLVVLQSLAARRRADLTVPIIAVTGTNGKTTTTRLIVKALSARYRVGATQGNFNNALGLPLSLLGVRADDEIVVLEMGANHPGEIASLCELARPTHGLITSIGMAHLEGFGGIEGVQRAKGELFAYLKKHRGTAFVRTDDAHVQSLSDDLHLGCSAVPYSLQQYQAHVRPCSLQLILEMEYDRAKVELSTRLIGSYNAINVVAAVHVAIYFNVPFLEAVDALRDFTPPDARSRCERRGGRDVIVDCYNANPSSMRAALENLCEIQKQGLECSAILGSMLELGSESVRSHREVIEVAKALGLRSIYLVGIEWGTLGANSGFTSYPDAAAMLRDWGNVRLPMGGVVLLKGSRGARMERLLPCLGEPEIMER